MRARISLFALAGLAGLTACGAGAGAEGGDGDDLRASEQAIRPDTPGNQELYRFDEGDVVETHGSKSGSFLVHFTRSGPNAVPAADLDGSGVPDFVEEVAGIYDEVQARYQGELGFRAPPSDEAVATDNGSDGRFDVYLVDFNGVGDGIFRTDACLDDKPQICPGYMVQENDYKGYSYPSTAIANRILASHEFFHAVQAAYDTGQGSVLGEGTAVWATEKFDASLKDFEGFIDGYLDNVDRPLTEPLPGPVDPFSYGAAIFFQFLDERYGGPIIRSLLERCEDGANGVADPGWFEALDPLLAESGGTSFAEGFTEFATWNLFTGSHADPARSYAFGKSYPKVAMTDVKAPYSEAGLRVFRASSQYYKVPVEGRASMTAALVAPSDKPDETAGLTLLLSPLTGSTYGEVQRVADAASGSEAVDTAGADSLVVVIVNAMQEGSSRRPGLCIGTAEEVQSCRSALVPVDTEPEPDVEEPSVTPPETVSREEPSGCDCGVPRSAPAGNGRNALWLVPLLALARLRQRRRH